MSASTRSPTIKRIHREARELSSSPAADFTAAPLESNLFEWHFTLRGPPSSPYESGIYHGRIVLPPTYPLRPPSFRFLTPSGRFEPNREICLSISGHHEETWQPAWGIRTALTAIRAFMEGDAKGQLGGVEAPKEVRERLAKESMRWKCAACGGKTCEDMLREGTEGATKGEASTDDKVPEELRLGYRDEMEAAGKKQSVEEKAETSSAPTPPVQSAAVQSQSPSASQPLETQTQETTPARLQQQQQQASPAQRRQRPRAASSFLDYAIAAVTLLLGILLLRLYLRFML